MIKHVVCLTSLFLLISPAHADWQSDLEAVFDIVDTFDSLEDWSHTSTSYEYGSAYMPDKQGGGDSIWQMYHTSFSHASGAEDVISDHGAYSWNRSGSSTPKSLCLQHDILYKTSDDADQGHGLQRLGTFWGDGTNPDSGYDKVYVFFMVKFRPGYFADKGTSDYAYMGYLKFFDILTGFTDIGDWGTAAERASTDGAPQRTTEYGVNWTVVNWQSGGATYGSDRLLPLETTGTATLNGSSEWTYEANIARVLSTGTVGIQSMYEANEWFGIEIAIDRGTVDQSNGTIDVWMYDDTGTEVGHYSKTGEARLVEFDHRFNKVVLGGNRSTGSGADDIVPDETRAYIDDFIVHDSRIGETYFTMLDGGTPTDETSPTVTATNITNQASGTTSVTPSLTATDDTDVTACKWATTDIVYGSMTNTMTETSGWSADSDYTGLSDDNTYTIYYGCTDAAGNLGYDNDSFDVLASTGGSSTKLRTGTTKLRAGTTILR